MTESCASTGWTVTASLAIATATLCSACGDSTSGAGGDASTQAASAGAGKGSTSGATGTCGRRKGYTGPDDDCTASICAKQGGVFVYDCFGAHGVTHACLSPAPAPGAGEFSCGGVLNCGPTSYCKLVRAGVGCGDGCDSEACVPLGACARDKTCDCIAAQTSYMQCNDQAGNITVTTCR